MSLKKLRQVRDDKWFRVADLIVYAAVAFLIVVLFIAFVFNTPKDPLKGFDVFYKNQTIFSYSFTNDNYKIYSDDNVVIVYEDETTLKLKLYSNEAKTDFNDVTVNKTERWVDVTEANCSTRKDCVFMDRIVDSSGGIMCTPHGIKILAFGYEKDYGGEDIII